MNKIGIISLAFLMIFLLCACAAYEFYEFPAEEMLDVEEEPVVEEVGDWVEGNDSAEIEHEADDFPQEPLEGLNIHGLLSRVEYGNNVVYIFGSMHYGRSSWYPLHPEVEAAMRRADVFAFETDVSPEGQLEVAPALASYMLLDGITLSEFLDEETYEHFMAIIETYGISSPSIERFTPWVISVMLAEMAYHEAGISSTYGIDFYVKDFANAHNLPILYLNPLEHEISLAFGLPDYLQHYAALSIPDFETSVREVESLVHAYEIQDIEQITTLARQDLLTSETLNPLEEYIIDVIVIQRSIEFAQEMIRYLQETAPPTTFFVTMGIGHMVGDDYGNVFNYLMSAGFEVVPLYR